MSQNGLKPLSVLKPSVGLSLVVMFILSNPLLLDSCVCVEDALQRNVVRACRRQCEELACHWWFGSVSDL